MAAPVYRSSRANFFMVQHFQDMALIDFRLVGKDYQKRLRQYMVMKARQGLARQEGQRKGGERAGQQGQAKARQGKARQGKVSITDI